MARADVSTLSDYLAILARHRLVLALVAVLVPAAAIGVSLMQEPLYEAEAHVLLSRQSLANTLQGTTDPTVFQEAERVVQTEAEIAASPAVARRVVGEVSEAGLSSGEFLEISAVESEPNVDLLRFSVRHEDPELASMLATVYADEFTDYRTEAATQPLVQARTEIRERIAELRAAGEDTTSPVLQSLLDKEQQLLTLETLQTGNATVVREAGEAEQVQPRTVRNAVLGVALGLGLGVLLAFAADALDTRVRTSEELAELLGLPLLGRLPPPARSVRRSGRPAMLVDPEGPGSEAFRMLRANVDFANLDVAAKTIMVTSGLEQEGKSTTVANLALAHAMAGRRVILVDLDLRRPALRQLFRIEPGPGLTDVLIGYTPLLDALAPVALPPAIEILGSVERRRGSLLVLQAGATPPNAGELVGSKHLRELLATLREQADLVLMDAPPMLQVGDALTLSAAVDALMIVTRLKLLRRPGLLELRRLLESSPAAKLGFAVTNAAPATGYAYARYEERPRRRWRRRLTGRGFDVQAPPQQGERRAAAGLRRL